MRRTSLAILILMFFVAPNGHAQQSNYTDFEEYRHAMEGRWVGEVTWVADLPGLGNRGDKTIAYAEIKAVADDRVLMGSFYGGGGTARWLTAFDAGSGQIRQRRMDSGGTMWDCVISKKEGHWTNVCTGSIADGTGVEVDLHLTISDNGDTHTWEGKIAILGEDADPLHEVWRRVGR